MARPRESSSFKAVTGATVLMIMPLYHSKVSSKLNTA